MTDEDDRPVVRDTALTVPTVPTDGAFQDISRHCATHSFYRTQFADLARAVKLRVWESEIPNSLQKSAVRQYRRPSHSLSATECALQQVKLRR